jgi:hypothetical protein
MPAAALFTSEAADVSWLEVLTDVIGTVISSERLGVGEIGAGPLGSHLIILRIDLDQHCSGLDVFVVPDIHIDDVSRNSRAHWIEMHIHLGVVSRLVAGEMAPQQHAADDHQKDPADQGDSYQCRPPGPVFVSHNMLLTDVHQSSGRSWHVPRRSLERAAAWPDCGCRCR